MGGQAFGEQPDAEAEASASSTTILDEFRSEVSAGRKIGEQPASGLCDVAGRAHLERSLTLIEVKCKKVPAINVQALPNFGR